MELEHLSASTIEMFSLCPRKGYLSKNLKDRPDLTSPPYLYVGEAVHKVLERYHSEGLGKYDSLVSMFEDVYKEYPPTSHQLFVSAISMLKDYEKAHPDPKNVPVVATEVEFLVDIGGYNVKGFIDRIDYHGDGKYEIVDYKTGYLAKKPWELESDVQLSIYDVAIRKMWKNGELVGLDEPKDVTCTLYYLRHGPISVKFDDEYREGFEKFVKAFGDYILNLTEEDALPSVNIYCGNCEFQGSCPVYVEGYEYFVDKDLDMSPEELADVYKQLSDYERTIRSRKYKIGDIIINYMDANGVESMKTPRGVVSLSRKRTYDYDLEQIKKVLPNWEDYVKFDSAKFKAEATDEEKEAVSRFVISRYGRPYPSFKVDKARKMRGMM